MPMQAITTTIPAGESLSTPVDLTNFHVLHLIMPSGWTGTAPISFQLSADGINWADLYRVEGGALIPYEVATHVVLNAVVSAPQATPDLYSFVRIRSGTRAVAVPQSADRVLGFLVVPATDPVALLHARAESYARRMPPPDRRPPAASNTASNTARRSRSA